MHVCAWWRALSFFVWNDQRLSYISCKMMTFNLLCVFVCVFSSYYKPQGWPQGSPKQDLWVWPLLLVSHRCKLPACRGYVVKYFFIPLRGKCVCHKWATNKQSVPQMSYKQTKCATNELQTNKVCHKWATNKQSVPQMSYKQTKCATNELQTNKVCHKWATNKQYLHVWRLHSWRVRSSVKARLTPSLPWPVQFPG